MRQQQSLPLTRRHGVPQLCVHPPPQSDQGLYISIHTAFCAAQALAAVKLGSLSFLVKQNKTDGSVFREHSGVVFKKLFPLLSNQKSSATRHLNPPWPGQGWLENSAALQCDRRIEVNDVYECYGIWSCCCDSSLCHR